MNFLNKTIILFLLTFLSCQAFALSTENITEHFSSIKNLESDFTIVRQFKEISKKPIVSGGKLYFQKPSQVKWEQEYPEKTGLLIDNKTIYLWKYNKAGKKEVRNVSKQKFAKNMSYTIFNFLFMDIAALEKSFNIKQEEDKISLRPKKDSNKTIEIYFDKDEVSVNKVVIIDEKWGTTIMSFDKTKINGNLPENAFSI
ncbi:MAG: outer membrane lipoprotein carrier protein LolA [Elusimicrobiota bacterium]|jgi:outer membrane lipoprotein-sorting protein|nr:outer membrane lipoprotein carrier protein LolA [Elusimicrobiota bacterium]